MRYAIFCELENNNIPLDYRRKILSLLKHSILEYDRQLYERMYGKDHHEEKEFCFSVYFPESQIEKTGIVVNSKKLIINFSTYDLELGINMYNSLIRQQWKSYDFSNINKIKITDIVLKREKVIKKDIVMFKTLSPIVIRDHNKETGKDWFLTFEDSDYEKILKRNLKSELPNIFGKEVISDVDKLVITNANMKKIVVRSYDIDIACSIGNFAVEGEQYLLNYFYKSGVGSKKGLGFSFLDIVE